MKILEEDLLANGFEKKENFYNGKLVSTTYSRPIQDCVIEMFRKIELIKSKYNKQK